MVTTERTANEGPVPLMAASTDPDRPEPSYDAGEDAYAAAELERRHEANRRALDKARQLT